MAGDLRAFLMSSGATEDEIERAAAGGWLPLLALDRMLMPERPRFDAAGVAKAAGTTPEVAARIWRALGFPDVPDGVDAFSERDARALHYVAEQLDGATTLDDLEHQVRIVSATLARLAAFEADVVADALDTLRATGADEESVAMELVEGAEWQRISEIIDYTHRLLFRAALWRRLARPNVGPTVVLAVGFADLAGYTELAESLDEHELSELLARFEAVAFDTVAANNGRLVKTIGDEVMFVGAPHDVAMIALSLVDRVVADATLPEVRVGVAYGSVLARDGDFYGPVVNLASRITGRARRGTVLASEALHAVLADDPDFSWRVLRTRRIRGIGEVALTVLRRSSRS
jgi:adenylate cyclase